MSGIVFNKNAMALGNARHISVLLARHADLNMPEQKLMLAVILKSVSDLMDPFKKNHRVLAGEFFARGSHVFFCDMCGLDPDWVLEILRDHAGLEV